MNVNEKKEIVNRYEFGIKAAFVISVFTAMLLVTTIVKVVAVFHRINTSVEVLNNKTASLHRRNTELQTDANKLKRELSRTWSDQIDSAVVQADTNYEVKGLQKDVEDWSYVFAKWCADLSNELTEFKNQSFLFPEQDLADMHIKWPWSLVRLDNHKMYVACWKEHSHTIRKSTEYGDYKVVLRHCKTGHFHMPGSDIKDNKEIKKVAAPIKAFPVKNKVIPEDVNADFRLVKGSVPICWYSGSNNITLNNVYAY